jgi:hypothetical protein
MLNNYLFNYRKRKKKEVNNLKKNGYFYLVVNYMWYKATYNLQGGRNFYIER